MQYYSSYVNYNGELNEMYYRYFTLNDKEYTLDIIEVSDTANKTEFTDVKRLIIGLSTDFSTFPSSYEEYLETTKKQP